MLIMDWQKYSRYAPAVLRIGLSLVILWFGFSQLVEQQSWMGYMPASMQTMHQRMMGFPEPTTLVLLNGAFEVVLGVLLLLGIWVRPVAGLLALHLLGIVFSLGYNEIAVRDFGLMMGFIAVMLHGKDEWCLQGRKS
jgi:uncharacterized membrane protein YphA (DoxX/SURF4 family)